MDHFIAAIQRGIPTAIFEDPMPVFAANVPATSMPRRPAQQNPMMMQQQPRPKGDLNKLWQLLGVDFAPAQVIWQQYNPYPKAGDMFPPEFVFVDEGITKEPFNEESPMVADLQQVLFPFPGSVDQAKLNETGLDFTWLARTGDETGTVPMRELMRMGMFGQPAGLNENPRRQPTDLPYTLAARIEGQVPAVEADDENDADEADADADDNAGNGESDDETDAEPKMVDVDVVVVADIDMLTPQFFQIREEGSRPELGFYFEFDNIPLVLNVLDALAGDTRFIDIRTRRPEYRTLTKIEERTEEAREKRAKAYERLQEELDKERQEAEQKLSEDIEKLRQRMEKEQLDPIEVTNRVQMVLSDRQRRLDIRMEQLQREIEQEKKLIDTELQLQKRRVEDTYKLWAVLLPPIPPLALAIVVFVARRARESEGVAETRLRKQKQG
jgi:ABC-2 type transport system permease protein